MTTGAMQRYQPIYNRNRSNPMPQPKRDLSEIVDKIVHLKQLTERTGFKTSRSIGQLLEHLSADELAMVNEALNHKL
jgi:hypothetical protein